MSGKRIVGMIGALMAVLGSGQALANTRTGISAYQRGDYATALREWEQGAGAGDPQALYNLGVAYAEGKAVPRDQARAVTYYQQGASKGSVLAAYNLGQAYRKGEGVGVDHAHVEPFVPRVTLTLPALASSREMLFLVTGDAKRDILSKIMAGADLPGARAHSNGVTTWLTDAAAAGRTA